MKNEKPVLPIRVVEPSDEFYKKSEPGGSPPKRFIDFEEYPEKFEEHKSKIVEKISDTAEKLEPNFDKFPQIPEIIKTELRGDAIAKSHRPNEIFEVDTCPIIGVGKLGELFVRVSRGGLNNLRERVSQPTTKAQKANITTISDISAYDQKDRTKGLSVKELHSKAQKNGQTFLKVILFNYLDEFLNQKVEQDFRQYITNLELEVHSISKFSGLKIWKIIGANEEQTKKISLHPAVKTLSFFPEYRVILPKEIVRESATLELPKPEKGKTYAKIGMIDTGVPPEHSFVGPWVIDKRTYVPDGYRNNNHGTMVATLLSLAQQVNDSGICPDKDNIQIFDLEMIPNGRRDYGPVDGIYEDDIIDRLQDAVPEFSNKYGIKVWNMSSGFKVKCEDQRFSSLAVFLDKFQDEHDLIFTLPSGNYIDTPQRNWPPQNQINNDEKDKLQQPGDSVRAITVGALACKQKPTSIVKINEPASYSCRGPGPCFTIKPELVHYSGNLSTVGGTFDFSGHGIEVFDEEGNLVETGGTSFSTPLVARTLALINENLIGDSSNNLIKALAIHNAHLPKNLGKEDEILPYVGFGMPTGIEEIFSCEDTEITLVFEQEIYPGYELIYPFAWPRSLMDESGRCRGKVKMTLVSQPPLNEGFGSEYVRANIKPQLQSKRYDKNGDIEWRGELQDTPAVGDLKELYEENLIKHGYKWKPIKRYERTFHRVNADGWQIKVRLLLRDAVPIDGMDPIKFALIFSLSDPEKTAPVYDEVVRGLRTVNLITNEIQLKSRIKQKVQTKRKI